MPLDVPQEQSHRGVRVSEEQLGPRSHSGLHPWRSQADSRAVGLQAPYRSLRDDMLQIQKMLRQMVNKAVTNGSHGDLLTELCFQPKSLG